MRTLSRNGAGGGLVQDPHAAASGLGHLNPIQAGTLVSVRQD